MTNSNIPSKHYNELARLFPETLAAVENLGTTIRKEGPIEEKTMHLIQLAAAAAVQSVGAVHSHTRRALQAGATKEEIHHALLLLISTIGFPRVAAAFSWIQDIINNENK